MQENQNNEIHGDTTVVQAEEPTTTEVKTEIVEDNVIVEEIKSYKKVNQSTDEKALERDPVDALTMPNEIYSKLLNVLESINTLTKEQTEQLYSSDEKKALTVDIDSVRTTNTDDMLYVDDNSTYENDVRYANGELNIRPLNIKPKNKKLSGDSITALLGAKTGIGTTIQVPLWHSGFWITLKPIKDAEIINLEIELAESNIELGRSTSALIYSNYSVIYNRIITNFIISHTIGSTLDLPISELRNYILAQDLYPIVNGMLYSMNPTGYEYIRACSKAATLDENDKPLCDYILEAKIDFRKLLYVDRKRLNTEMLLQMSKRTPKSLTQEEVIEYQRLIQKDNILTITTSNGLEVKFILQLPTLESYITSGELWVNNIISDTEKLFTDTTDNEVKNNLIAEMTMTTVLGMYNAFIAKIEFEDYEIDTLEDINTALETLSADDATVTSLIDGIKSFINKNTIAMVGLTNFNCPKCSASQSEHRVVNFKEIIPLNVVESFFDLCTLRIQKLDM